MISIMRSINPANGQEIKLYHEHTPQQCDQIIEGVFDTLNDWKSTTFEYRSKLMFRAADILEERKIEFGLLITREMGKIIGEAVAEVEKSAWVCRYYAENAANILKQTNSGLISDFNDVNKLKNNILEYYNLFKSKKLISESIGIEKFSRKELSKKLAELLKSV